MKLYFVFVLLSVVFVILSFSPSLYEIVSRKQLPPERAFELVHNYLFDYNFYLSRIREGEGRWSVVEKYYNEPHSGSLIQVVYLYMGKIGGVLGMSPTAVYHTGRLMLGLVFLLLISGFTKKLFSPGWSIVSFLLIVTAGSFPALVWVGGYPRFATYMGWWSAIDSLQRITFIPHILIGQIGLLLLLMVADNPPKTPLSFVGWGAWGFIIGIIFPPTIVMLYMIYAVLSVLEWIENGSYKSMKLMHRWFIDKGFFRIMVILLSLPALVYLQLTLSIMPWKALALFDIQHRFIFPYKEYLLAVGSMLPLGILGMILVIIRKERKYFMLSAWVVGIFALFKIFQNFPQQSPLRFTEGAIQIPLGILATHFFVNILSYLSHLSNLRLRKTLMIAVTGVIGILIIMGLSVMLSMVGWLTDQAYAKRVGTWEVPLGSQLVYPLKDFMAGVEYLRDHTSNRTVVLGYITAGNYIPAYAGNFVYIGHANTPDEDGKEKVAARFFRGEMNTDEVQEFIKNNRISYVYFGPQERGLGGVSDLSGVYSFLVTVYHNSRVSIYEVRGSK